MQNEQEKKNADWPMPVWLKGVWTLCVLSGWFLFVRVLLIEPRSFFGLSSVALLVVFLGLAALFSPVLIAFWFFPAGRPALVFYWLVRFLREAICAFSLLGLLYLYIIHAPLASLRGAIPFLNLVLFFISGFFARPVRLDQFPVAVHERLFIPARKLADKINAIPLWVLGIAAALLPALVICAIVYFGLHAHLSDYRPYSSWNDETGYWVWLRSFSQVGFNSGYNAPNELIAPLTFSRYGEGSPFYIYLYGAVARLVGWSPQLPLLINFVLLAVVIFWFTRFLHFDALQIFFTSLVTLLTWPVLIFLATTSHETLNQAIGFVMAGIFYLLLTRDMLKPTTKVLFLLFLYFAAFIRLSWGLLFVPLLYLSLNGSVLRRAGLSILIGAGLFLSTIVITGYLVPPVNNSIFVKAQQSLVSGPQVLVEYIFDQFKWMLRPGQLTPNIAVVFELFVILGWSLLRFSRLFRARLSLAAALRTRTALDIYNVVTLLLAGLMFYLQEGFYRTFIPPMLVIFLLMVAQKDYKFLGTLLVLHLVFFSAYINYFGHAEALKTNFTAHIPAIAQSQGTVDQFVAFDAGASNPWCNTILIPLDDYDYRVTIIPPGIGISYVLDAATIRTPLKSNYLLFDRQTYEMFSDKLNVKLLASLPIGDLYHNLDSGCKVNK